jgi:hypothetical protein
MPSMVGTKILLDTWTISEIRYMEEVNPAASRALALLPNRTVPEISVLSLRHT